ncbi:TetR/AcrR family transcriptional regulator [Agilicoccus flavus]|uniref:TetR/AcrR family transcriptional regulator n=1 Tax=Agilicoccus flavus TaxID=2775968 RepID=UPI001CF68BF1|nr:TetR/AcrR family transcriptional regulator [Agilicoccus flavus]
MTDSAARASRDEPPQGPPATARVQQIVAAARVLLEEHGWEAISMRTVADRLGIRAPSLYKHIAGKEELQAALVADGLREMGAALHGCVADAGVLDSSDAADRAARVRALLGTYRRHALANGAMYRLATSGPLRREVLPDGLEEWAGRPFWLVTGDPIRAQALWAATHGLAVLELDGRFPPGSPVDKAWAATAWAFA